VGKVIYWLDSASSISEFTGNYGMTP